MKLVSYTTSPLLLNKYYYVVSSIEDYLKLHIENKELYVEEIKDILKTHPFLWVNVDGTLGKK